MAFLKVPDLREFLSKFNFETQNRKISSIKVQTSIFSFIAIKLCEIWASQIGDFSTFSLLAQKRHQDQNPDLRALWTSRVILSAQNRLIT